MNSVCLLWTKIQDGIKMNSPALMKKGLTSITDEPTAQAIGLPPNVLKWKAFPKDAAISGK